MAQMIPDSEPARASRGELLLYKVLRDRLPDNYIVWYEPIVKGLHPDFVILGPDFGLLVIEVKGWSAGQIEEANNNFFRIKQTKKGPTYSESQQSPLRQGKGYIDAVMDKLKGEAILAHHTGNYQGKLMFPTGFGAVMSNITTSQAHDHNIYTLLEQPQVAYRDELLEWEDYSDEELIQRLKAMFKVSFSFPALTNDQISTIKGILHPAIVIKKKPATPDSVPEGVELPSDSSVLVTLDIDQEKLARSMKDGHRLFSGVAGSGKTLILLSRARAIANRLTGHRVLILCFNITLASHLRSLLHSDSQNPQYQERIEILNFHAWARSLLGSLPNPREFRSDEEYDKCLSARVLSILQQLPLEQKWDSVLVDEAHTFSPDWFLCCVAALKDPQDGVLLVVSDGSQSLYKRRKFTWKSVGIKAQGRSERLNQNYRNTQEILTAAWSVVKPASGEVKVEDDVTFPIVEPSAALRQGAKPVLHLSRSKDEAVEALINQVRSLSESGYAPGDIAILYRWYREKDKPMFDEMLKRLSDLGLRSYWITESDDTKREYSVTKPGIRVLTSLSSLGLEFKVVLLLWAEQFSDCCNSDREEAAMARRQLYVAMTRAQDELHLLGSGSTRILQELQQSQSFEILQESATPVK
ncbi:NERD domain-containing protein [Cyanobacteria bacterium FACHB-63]|nr:NERD domain-containing protein [Cyanobacteria bacterium FACHB-63]